MALLLFGVILIVIAVAVAVPVLAYGEGRVDDADAVVLGAATLGSGLGGLNLLVLVVLVLAGDVPASAVAFGLLPLAGGVLGASAVRRHARGGPRLFLLGGAAALTLADIPGYLSPLVAVLAQPGAPAVS